MTNYYVGHMWQTASGQPYLRVLDGTVENIDIAFYAADLLAEFTGKLAGVYVLDADTAQLTRITDRPERTTPDEDMPALRVTPAADPTNPPDLVTAPNAGGGSGIGCATTEPDPDAAPTSEETTTTLPGN